MSRRRLVTMALGLLASVGWCAVACDRNTSAPTANAQTPGGSAEPEAASDDRFQTTSSPSTIPVGTSTSVTLGIEAGAGLKVNREFPTWRLDLESAPGIDLANDTFERESFDLEENRAEVSADVTVSALGPVSLEGTATFSVCNDTKCHVLREEPVTFALEGTATDTSARPAKGERRQ